MTHIPSFVLKTGQNFPGLVYGTYKITPDTCETVKRAISLGYTNIDCAKAYQNEAGIGDAQYGQTGKTVYLSEIEFSGLKPAKTSKTRLKKCFY